VLGNGLSAGEQDVLQEIEFPFVLDFDEEDFLVAVADLEVDPVGPVPEMVTVALAFQELQDFGCRP